MKKFKEILFLKNLKRVGNAAINGKYNKILTDAENIDDLILKLKNIESKFSDEDLHMAKNKAEDIFDYVETMDINVITIFDDTYPKSLDVMKNSKPTILYVKGNIKALEMPNISVIGTRKPLKSSEIFEKNLVKNIVNNLDRVIVSGLALGCDKIAHQTTLDENKTTIAVLPSGIDVITPASHKKLASDIITNGGCLISEYNPTSKAFKGTYLARDKIVAALSDATFVVECGVKSGTMKTVKEADKFQKQIYTYIPSKRDEGQYDGNEHILKNYHNVIEVENIEEFIGDLKALKSKSPQQTF